MKYYWDLFRWRFVAFWWLVRWTVNGMPIDGHHPYWSERLQLGMWCRPQIIAENWRLCRSWILKDYQESIPIQQFIDEMKAEIRNRK